MRDLINFHRQDENIGDLMSAPTSYFDFPDHRVRRVDIADVEAIDTSNCDVIVGGGGLFGEYFISMIRGLAAKKERGRLVAWGVGQQLSNGAWWREWKRFRYDKYINEFDAIGVRDVNVNLRWVPCASCMHPVFDVKKEPVHDLVIFSHHARRIPIKGFPEISNNCVDFETVIDFISSGDTVLTSSYHGMYWAMLLGRRVVAFPFNSKFFSQRYPVTIYPAVWQRRGRVRSLANRLLARDVGEFECMNVSGWRMLADNALRFPHALDECREANRLFYGDVKGVFS